MVATEGRRGTVARIPWRVIERARWVAIQVDGMDGALAEHVREAVAQASGVITVELLEAHTVVITFDPVVTAPGALTDMVACVAAIAHDATVGAVTTMRTGSLPPAQQAAS